MSRLTRDLEKRRRDLGMSRRNVATRAGVGLATVQRALAKGCATIQTMERIARALGTEIGVAGGARVSQMRQARALEKARHLVGLVQGTSALESQAVGAAAAQAMVERTVVDLLKGSSRRLWAE